MSTITKPGPAPGISGPVTVAVMDVADMLTGRWFTAKEVAAHYPNLKTESIRRSLYRLTEDGLLRSRRGRLSAAGQRIREWTYNEEQP